MRLYDSIKYAESNNVSLCIKYDNKDDVIIITAAKTDGVNLYQKEIRMYGIDLIDPRPGDLLFGNVKTLIDKLISCITPK